MNASEPRHTDSVAGAQDEPIRLVSYDPAWPERFAEERAALEAARLSLRALPAEEMQWFCKPHPSRRSHHLHLAPTDSNRFRDELAFRDQLRADPETAAEYAALKHELAARFSDEREAYTEGKPEFIRHVLDSA